ncbi:hypothetical protein FRUB_01201 [Fimbriiglobus ruber]|uniref:DUF6798 domain-containing protein n=1 Tax=Fimbriiglobus ruber TaxID=1908690 RepID=A0A225E1P1_9BACT|nr:hypothetical protein FRUB_01201 [Fimbriiglobus ruber]
MLFAVTHTQPPLYYSNQNQYFLHGLAAAGYGDLRTDWLANTRDPTPVFSAGIALADRACGEWAFHAAFFALLVVYFLGLWSVAAVLPFRPITTAGRVALAGGLIVVHSAAVRVLSVKLVGVDYPWYAQAGVANQYLLGAGLQPSVFGVLLLVALAAFAGKRYVAAGAFCAAACVFHSTYLLPAGLLVAGMCLGLLLSSQIGGAMRVGTVALVGVLPVIAYTLSTFAPSSPEQFTEAQKVLAWVRIPHHTDVHRWLDGVAWVQIVWAGAGLIAFRRTPLFFPLAVAAVVALLLSVAQVWSGNATFALMFPWRISALLVPLATAAALTGLACFVERIPAGRVIAASIGLTAVAAVGGAAWVYAEHLGYQGSAAEDGLQRHVAQTRQPGDVYLLPCGFPKPPAARGSAAATFVPVPQTGRPAVFELQRFRLATGAATFVDFKSVPYQDAEVLEWRRRVTACERWYATERWDETGVMDEVRADDVTHVVVPAGVHVTSKWLTETYADAAYHVYRLEQK